MTRIAIPSKRSFKESKKYIESIYGKIEIDDDRNYIGKIGDDIDVLFLPPKEIVRRIENKQIDIGIAGYDLLFRNDNIKLIEPLGFGKGNIVLAIHEKWVDVNCIDSFKKVAKDFLAINNRPIRIATKYKEIAINFLEDLFIYDVCLIESLGSTESIINEGMAEAIIDFSETGKTLKANNLRAIHTITDSQMYLISPFDYDYE